MKDNKGNEIQKGTKCECYDPRCPVQPNDGRTTRPHHNVPATIIVYRIDMEDNTGTAMCEDCATDAFESGLFESDNNDYSEAL